MHDVLAECAEGISASDLTRRNHVERQADAVIAYLSALVPGARPEGA
jgi:hypothetical protein